MNLKCDDRQEVGGMRMVVLFLFILVFVWLQVSVLDVK